MDGGLVGSSTTTSETTQGFSDGFSGGKFRQMGRGKMLQMLHFFVNF